MSEFLTKDEFHEYVIDNRDRQDENKKEIIDTLTTAIEKDIEAVGDRVTELEKDNRKQNRIATAVTAIGGLLILLLGLTN